METYIFSKNLKESFCDIVLCIYYIYINRERETEREGVFNKK